MNGASDIRLIKFYLWLGLGYFLLSTVGMAGYYPGKFLYVLLNNFWGIIYVVPLNYLFFEHTIPFIFKKKRYIFYNVLYGLLLIFIFSMFYSYGSYAWRLLGKVLNIYSFLDQPFSLNKFLQFQMSYSMLSVFLFGIIRHIYNFVQLKQSEQALRIGKQEAELNYLRSQTNPHFLFNTLNNIYSLARDKSDLAPESILRLSKILRFMLYDIKGDYISIGEELKIITDYIELEKLRYDESLRVSFNHDVEDMNQALPPLLLIPLVENAFKHGVSETRTDPFVNIHLSIKNRQLLFTVKNSVEGVQPDQPVKENIGLSNLRRQLELLYADWDLSVQQTGTAFTAILKINLASHV